MTQTGNGALSLSDIELLNKMPIFLLDEQDIHGRTILYFDESRVTNVGVQPVVGGTGGTSDDTATDTGDDDYAVNLNDTNANIDTQQQNNKTADDDASSFGGASFGGTIATTTTITTVMNNNNSNNNNNVVFDRIGFVSINFVWFGLAKFLSVRACIL